MAINKRSVNGKLIPASSKSDPDYKNHILLVNFTELVRQVVSSSDSATSATPDKTSAGKATSSKTKSKASTTEIASEKTLVKTSSSTAGQSSAPSATGGAQPSVTTQEIQVKRSYAIPVSPNGDFQFKISESDDIAGNINLKVVKPGGGVLKEKEVTYSGLKTVADPGVSADQSSELTIQVDPYEPIILANETNPQPYKVSGRVISFDNGEPLKEWTIFIYALHEEVPAGSAPTVIAAIKTDSSGYYSFQMPAGKLNTAHVSIAGLENQTFPLMLTDSSLAAQSQITVFGSIDDIDTDCDQDDCGCHGNITPSLPDATDLVNSGAYSDDLGGNCVDFTTPNRSLEEFNYYSIVRTTEPEIERVPYKKPPLLVLGDLEKAQNAPVVANGLAFDKEVEKWNAKSTKDVQGMVDFFGHVAGFAQFGQALANDQMKWWIFETSVLSFLGVKSRNFPGVTSQYFQALEDMLAIIDSQHSDFMTYFCIDMVQKGYKLFYGKIAPNLNDAYAFLYFAGARYFEQYNKLPEDPDELEKFIENVLTKTGGIGPAEWWPFYIDYNTYSAPNGLSPLEHLKHELTRVYTQINSRPPQLEAELLEFLRMAINYFKEDYDRIPNTPEEILSYISATFSGDSKSRLHLTGHHAIDWDETPVLHHNTTISHGHILNFKQVWKADGYSLGDLLYSLPLAPCQKKQIAIFDWDRNESASRGEQVNSSESMNAFLNRDRDVTDIVSSSLSESIKGGSQTQTSGNSFGGGFGTGGGAAGSGSYGPLSLGVAGGASLGIGGQTSSGSSSSSAWQDSARNVSANSLNKLRDKVMQSASAVRSQRTTVVQAVNQNESVNVQTDVVANHNHCHSMTVEYFEVLRHFAIEQQLADVQECLFVPLEITPFTIHKILRWRHELQNSIGYGELVKGFEALDVIKNKYMVEGTGPITILADEEIQEMSGMLEFNISIDSPLRVVEDTVGTVKTVLDDVAYALFGHLPGVRQFNEVKSNLESKAQQERDRYYREEILPDILAGFLRQLRFGYEDADGQRTLLPFDITVVPGHEDATRYMARNTMTTRRGAIRKAIKDNAPGEPLKLFVRYTKQVSRKRNHSKRRSDMVKFFIQNSAQLPTGSQVLFNGGYINYQTASLNETLFTHNEYYDDLAANDEVVLTTPLNTTELENPIKKNYELANSLIVHLNDHLEYYHKAIWWQMDADKRFMLMDGFVAPNSGNRSVASVIENRLMAIVGNNLVFPVAKGMHLDPSFSQSEEEAVDLFAHYAPTTPIAPFRLSVPTRGVYAEAVMGSCNSCEVMDESRHWRFSEVPCGDTPTPIQPISVDSRRSDPGNLQAKDLAPNIINFQNVPNAPDPQGFGQALQLLATPGIFDNVTGLTENQKNALAALQANQKGAIDAMKMNVEAAQEYAKMATKLVSQEKMLKNGDKVMRNIDKQEKDNKISSEDATEFRKDIIKNQIGGVDEDDSNSGNEDKNVNVSPTKALLPDNPAQFASYSATGEGGEQVQFETHPDAVQGGNEDGDGTAATAAINNDVEGGYELKSNLLSNGLIWKGFRHQWMLVNHRTNRIGDILVPAEDANDVPVTNGVDIIHTGASGAAEDVLKHESFFTEVVSDDVQFYAGVAEITDLGKQNGQSVSRTLQISEDLPVNMRNKDLHVFLNGFDLYANDKSASRKLIHLKIEPNSPVHKVQNDTKFWLSIGIEIMLDCQTGECIFPVETTSHTWGKYDYTLRVGYLIVAADASDLSVTDIPGADTKKDIVSVLTNSGQEVELKSAHDIVTPTSDHLRSNPDPSYEIVENDTIQVALGSSSILKACTAVKSIEFDNDLTTHENPAGPGTGPIAVPIGSHAYGHTLEMNMAITAEQIQSGNLESTQELFFKNWREGMNQVQGTSFKSAGTASMNMKLSLLEFTNSNTQIIHKSTADPDLYNESYVSLDRSDYDKSLLNDNFKSSLDGRPFIVWLGRKGVSSGVDRSANGSDATNQIAYRLNS